jgi:hypothetical protein
MKLTCFVMMQFSGETQNSVFTKIEEGINQFNTTTEHEVELTRADLTPPLDIGSLEEHLKRQIECCNFAIAEISQLNPNVLYEMGYAAGVGKPVIIMVQEGVRLPADFGGRLYFRYSIGELNLLPQKLQGFFLGAVEALLAKKYLRKYVVPCYETREVSDISDKLTSAKERIDIHTTNLYSLVEAGHIATIKEQLRSQSTLKVRILTLDPESDLTAHRARQLGISMRHFRDQLRESLEKTSHCLIEFPEQCRIATYNEFPTQITFRIDDLVFFHVVSANRQSRNNPILSFNVFSAGVAESVLSHFDTVSSVTQKQPLGVG